MTPIGKYNRGLKRMAKDDESRAGPQIQLFRCDVSQNLPHAIAGLSFGVEKQSDVDAVHESVVRLAWLNA